MRRRQATHSSILVTFGSIPSFDTDVNRNSKTKLVEILDYIKKFCWCGYLLASYSNFLFPCLCFVTNRTMRSKCVFKDIKITLPVANSLIFTKIFMMLLIKIRILVIFILTCLNIHFKSSNAASTYDSNYIDFISHVNAC